MDKKLQVEVKKALAAISSALDICADWNFPDVQVDPPKEWGLDAYTESKDDGWCSTRELAAKLKKLAEQI